MLNIENELRSLVEGKYTPQWGYTVIIYEVTSVGKGIVDVNDASVHYNVTFQALVFVPKVDEVLMCVVKRISGFIVANCGPLEIVISTENVGENRGEYELDDSQGEARFVSAHDEIQVGSKVYVKIIQMNCSLAATVAVGKLLRSVKHE